MSAYRHLSHEDLNAVCRVAGADALSDCQPIEAGIENSNWFVTLVYGARHVPCVLTIAEATPAEELPYFIALTDALAEADLPVPTALTLTQRQRQFELQGRPAWLVPRMPGTHLAEATPSLCRTAGEMLALLHRHASGCAFQRERPDHRWWPSAFASVSALLPVPERDELAGALLAASRAFAQAHALPHGVIHGDLFRDNVLVRGERITAVLDFFHATSDLLAWDIAIAMNDWTVTHGAPDAALADAFLDGYAHVRALTIGEHRALPALRCAAAARFWLSRLIAAQRPAQGTATVQRKDPQEMRALWQRLRDMS
jgi:homoserine kinase type II